MKSRRFRKKLVFSKKTIVNLNDVTLKGVWAGGPTVPDTEYCTQFGFTCDPSLIPEACCATKPIS